MNYAPIIITTLCRFEHFRRCVSSLSRCKYAELTDLYIGIDFPTRSSHLGGYQQILKYVSTISGFKKVIIFKRTSNLGPFENLNRLKRVVMDSYDTYIVTEDDNEFSVNFLAYINAGLEKYKNDFSIFAVCGYHFPVEIPVDYQSNIYIWKGFSAWGYGTWTNRFNAQVRSYEYVYSFLRKWKNFQRMNSYAPTFVSHAFQLVESTHLTGDTCICVNLIEQGKNCIFPVISKVRNHGHDGSGAHCDNLEVDIYNRQVIDQNQDFIYFDSELKESSLVNKILRQHFDLPIKAKLHNLLKYLFLQFVRIN